MTIRPGSRGILLALPWVVATVVVGPLLLERGFWLFGDMVFTPHQPWKPEWYGGDGGVPRAVPSDALVSGLTHLVPGDLVQKVVLFALIGVAGWGVIRLLPEVPSVAAGAACVVYQWNPYVFERLAIGHWALLCGYAALPWVVAGSVRVAHHGWVRWPALFLPLAVAAWTSPTGGVLAGGVAVAVTLGAADQGVRWRRTAMVTACVAATNLPWVVPGFLATADAPVDTTGASAFAATADTPLGSLVSLVTLGGIWKTSIVPAERGSVVLVVLALVVVLIGLAGIARAWRQRRDTYVGLVVLAVLLAAFALATTTGPGQSLSAWVAETIPGGGIVRDAQKLLAPLALVVALGVGRAGEWLVERAGSDRRLGASVLIAVVALVQVMSLPSLAWGRLGQWPVSTYPSEWEAVAQEVERMPEAVRNGTVVLPFSVYRRFEFNGEMAWLDPAPRILPGRVLVDDRLGLGEGSAVAGESRAADLVRRTSHEWSTLDRSLDELKVRFVLIEHDTPGALPDGAPADVGYDVLHEGPGLTLYDRGPQAPAPAPPSWAPYLLALDAGLGVMFVIAAGVVFRRRRESL